MSVLLDQHIAHIRRRVIEDALAEATATHWERRADDFDAVPLPDVALACRRHAQLMRETGLDTEAQQLLDNILDRIGKGAA